MKRDMDLVRKILLAAEASPHGLVRESISIDGYSPEQVGYHIYLMMQADLVDGSDVTTRGSQSPQAVLTQLTWAGHEFIDAARSPAVWEQSKGVIGKLGDVSFAVWTQVLTKITMANLGL